MKDTDNRSQCFGGNNTSGEIDAAAALNAKGGAGRSDFESETFVVHSLKAEGFDASEDGTGRGVPILPVIPFGRAQITSATNRSAAKAGDPQPPLCAGGDAMVAECVT